MKNKILFFIIVVNCVMFEERSVGLILSRLNKYFLGKMKRNETYEKVTNKIVFFIIFIVFAVFSIGVIFYEKSRYRTFSINGYKYNMDKQNIYHIPEDQVGPNISKIFNNFCRLFSVTFLLGLQLVLPFLSRLIGIEISYRALCKNSYEFESMGQISGPPNKYLVLINFIITVFVYAPNYLFYTLNHMGGDKGYYDCWKYGSEKEIWNCVDYKEKTEMLRFYWFSHIPWILFNLALIINYMFRKDEYYILDIKPAVQQIIKRDSSTQMEVDHPV